MPCGRCGGGSHAAAASDTGGRSRSPWSIKASTTVPLTSQGIDPAKKTIDRRKRHIVTDTLGLMPALPSPQPACTTPPPAPNSSQAGPHAKNPRPTTRYDVGKTTRRPESIIERDSLSG